MWRYIIVRLGQGVLALLLLSVVIFLLARASGDPLNLILPVDATEEDYARVSKALGLDRSLPVQYGIFAINAVKGDLGMSLRGRRPVTELLAERLPNSIKLATASIVAALLIAFPLGVIGAVKKGKPIATLVTVIAVLGQALPPFYVGILLIEFVSVRTGILPVAGMGGPAHYVLPSLTIGLFIVAGITRLLRSSMLDVLDTEYVKLARIKGVSETVVVWQHVLRNALIPVVTFAAMYFAAIVTMAVVVEVVFGWPGVGRLAFEAIMFRDFPVIQGVVLVTAIIVISINLIVDILYAWLDPRIRYGSA